ncbi:MAG: hypothetical protein KBD01_05755 [Acidobacteria bacterium]|nr:hypothetical protein [Acidobacteriota bacterium]
MDSWRVAVVVTGIAACGLLAGCTASTTAISRETAARPRVEQKALVSAMEGAYAKVDFSVCRGRKVFVETRALSKTDVEFITSYVQKQALAARCVPVIDEQEADLKMTSMLEVSGTDEVERRMLKDVVVGQFTGTLTVTDLREGAVIKAWDLHAMSQTKRNRRATTSTLK